MYNEMSGLKNEQNSFSTSTPLLYYVLYAIWHIIYRWEDCVKRDVRKAGEEEDWKKKTRDRGGWKRLSDEAVKKLRAAPHP